MALRRRNDDAIESSLRDPVAAAATAATCDAIVNLSGEPVAQRWSVAVKRRIEDSRVELPRRFLEALAAHERTARVYVSASGIGYYGTSESETFDEESPAGNDFLAHVCEAWEREAFQARALGMRVAVIRTGLALGSDGGALAKMLPPFRLGLGGVIGDGRQWFSWVHIDDVVGVYLAALDRGEGAFNATAPNPVTNAELTRTLGAVLHRPARLPTPTFALRLMLGEAAEVVLTGQRVISKRVTEDLGYTFAFATLDEALKNLLHRGSTA
jgi:hypothetical protein